MYIALNFRVQELKSYSYTKMKPIYFLKESTYLENTRPLLKKLQKIGLKLIL